MLSEQQLELLTAFVDGELTGRDRKLAVRLVRRSPAARRLLKELEKDSHQLAALPKKLPPRELPQQVMHRIAGEAAPVPATPSTLAAPTVPAANWLGLVVAASILIAVAVGSFLYFSQEPAPQIGPL